MRPEDSGKQVRKAGDILRTFDIDTTPDEEFQFAMDVLSFWRFGHETALNAALALLQDQCRTKDRHAIFAKRLKRVVSIYRKLLRYDKMSLKSMQDIGGCRAVLTNEKKLRQVVRTLRKRPEFRGDNGTFRFKDYITTPKPDGYRGYHLIGRFPDENRILKNIELQLRTRIQHYWATAVEIVDLFTGQALKSNQGNPYWSEFFREVSKQFAVMESIHLFETLSADQKFEKYRAEMLRTQENRLSWRRVNELSDSLKVLTNLEAYAGSIQIADEQLSKNPDWGYGLLRVDTVNHLVNSEIFEADESASAEEQYIEAEKEAATQQGLVISLVSSSSLGGIKEAYPNYFADSTEFAKHLSLIITRN